MSGKNIESPYDENNDNRNRSHFQGVGENSYAWVCQMGREFTGEFMELPCRECAAKASEIKKALGYDQMDIYVPIKIRGQE